MLFNTFILPLAFHQSYFDIFDLGPKRWSKRYVGAEGELQSPINIIKDNVHKDSSLGPLMVSYGPSSNCTLTNDGRTLQITMTNRGHKNSEYRVVLFIIDSVDSYFLAAGDVFIVLLCNHLLLHSETFHYSFAHLFSFIWSFI